MTCVWSTRTPYFCIQEWHERQESNKMGLPCPLVLVLPWEQEWDLLRHQERNVIDCFPLLLCVLESNFLISHTTHKGSRTIFVTSPSVFFLVLFIRFISYKKDSSLLHHQVLLFLAQLCHGARFQDQVTVFSLVRTTLHEPCNMRFFFLGIPRWQTPSLFLDFFPTF